MITSPSYTNKQSFVADEFNRIRVRARQRFLFAKVFGKVQELRFLSEDAWGETATKKYAGIQNIPTEKILGTVSRVNDFDQEFRPLKKHLRQRWVNMFLLHEEDGWAPIVVHQVGEAYYVEDGHHRVSVARTMGMMFIEAEVWDHSAPKVESCVERQACRLVTNPATVCAAD